MIGPEAPLVDGLADNLRTMGFCVFGPNRIPAQLEGSKGFTKDLCARHGIPTARYARASDRLAAEAALEDFGLPAGDQGRRPRRRQGRDHRRDPRRRRRRRSTTMFDGGFGGAGERGRDRGIPRRRGSELLRADRRRRRSSRSARPRTTSASATATPAPIPAAWAPTARPRSSPPSSRRGRWTRSSRPTVEALAGAGHALFGHPLCRADADRRRARS